MEVLRKLDEPSVEQDIAVPEISLDWVPQRSAVQRPQTAEQLVEVPTERGYVFAIIATKALGGGEHGHWPSSSLPLQFLRVGGEVVEVFKMLEQDRVLQQWL